MKQTVYIASPESQQIHVWNLNHEGALTLTQVVDVPGQVQPMVVSPDKRYLYVGVRPEFRVLAYRIAPDDGALTFAESLRCRVSPTHISTDHQGQFILLGLQCGKRERNASGRWPASRRRRCGRGLDGCHSANISPDNRTLWVPALKQESHLPVYGQR
ncbi:beta-propeller fold lactonase family protein [Escherichia coli]